MSLAWIFISELSERSDNISLIISNASLESVLELALNSKFLTPCMTDSLIIILSLGVSVSSLGLDSVGLDLFSLAFFFSVGLTLTLLSITRLSKAVLNTPTVIFCSSKSVNIL